jgi:hypothetical protein
MGYTTDFYGSFTLSRPATEKEKNYINLFGDTRRMKRDVNKLMELFKGKHGYPFAKDNTPEAIYGKDGEYFARNDGQSGQDHDKSIIDYNCPPGQLEWEKDSDFHKRYYENQRRTLAGECQPGLWCQWRLNDKGTELEWDGSEKFYNYIEWLKYLINHFFEPWGIKLNGEVEWQGEDSDDFGKIIATDNVVTVKIGRKTYD